MPSEQKHNRQQSLIKPPIYLAGSRDIKPKTKAFADKLLADPKISATEAYLETHTTNSRKTASVKSTELLKKPSVRIYMKKHVDRARTRVVELMESDKLDIALKASTDILDREYGKAIARSESQTTSLNLNVEASQELADNFASFLKQSTNK